ncbi:MAG: pyrroline-5-carboxylate reductase [Lachnospiraceae bacterium]|nr:pyrroline-5-carboxylate reductase [Lachnospiraceae bacterium]
MAKIGFVGMGNLGYAMLKGILKTYKPSDIIFSQRNLDKMKKVSSETGVEYATSNAECVNKSKYVILAVKSQMFDDVFDSIKNVVTKEHVIISLAPGITIEQIRERLGYDLRVVRTMPNTPALVGEAMTGVCYDEKIFSDEEKEIIERLFTSIGKMKIVPEKLMDAVVCASGSSPAYVYMFIEALADGAVKCGMPRNDAYEFVAQTVFGSAKMVLDTKAHPGILKDMVCSPGGTTIAAVEKLEEYGFRNAIMKATDACYDKCHNIK